MLEINSIVEEFDLAPEPTIAATLDIGQLRQAIELALRLGDHDAASQAAIALHQRCPEAIIPLLLHGQALLDAGNPVASVDYFRRVLKLNPIDAVAWAGLAGALARCGHPGAAEATLARSALHDPLGSQSLAPGVADNAQPLGMGIIYLRRGHAALAAAELKNIVEQHHQRDDLRIYYIEALRRSGDLEGARKQFEIIVYSGAPTLPILLLQAALDPGYSGDMARARAARSDPDGHFTRRFFAPERPPWDLAPTPAISWAEEFAAIISYLDMLPANTQPPVQNIQKSATPGNNTAVPHRAGPPPTIDPDVGSYLSTTEQLRHRLADLGAAIRPLSPWNAEQPRTQMILSSRAALRRRYGEDGFTAIDRRLHALSGALRRRGIHVHCCYTDDAASLHLNNEIALAPVSHHPAAIRDLVRDAASALGEHGHELGTLLLVGGDDIIPLHRLPNPIPDDDEVIPSDNPYASDDAAYLIPQRIVARLPDGASGNPELLLTQLDHLLDFHHGVGPHRERITSLRGAALQRLLHTRWRNKASHVAGYCAEAWQESSRSILDMLDPEAPLGSCPPTDSETLDLHALNHSQILYCNLHGAAGLPNFYGQPDTPWLSPATRLPVALRPDQITSEMIAGGMILSEACYGAEFTGRTANNSILLRGLSEGALACLGATVNAYGSLTTPLVGADLLFQRLLTHLAHGIPIGEALHRARMDFAQAMYQRQGYLDDVDLKTLIEFVLLGDPWVGMDASGSGKPGKLASEHAPVQHTYRPQPKAVLTESDVPRDLVRRAREALRRVLPGAGTAQLRITAQPNPRRQRKGEVLQDLVFSARETRPTADGYYVSQTAHVTVSGRAVVKVVITR